MSLQEENEKYRETSFYRLVQKVADWSVRLVYGIVGLFKRK